MAVAVAVAVAVACVARPGGQMEPFLVASRVLGVCYVCGRTHIKATTRVRHVSSSFFLSRVLDSCLGVRGKRFIYRWR